MTGKKRLSIYSVPNFLDRLQTKHLIHTGIIYIPSIIDINLYYILHQNQNYLNGKYWKEFRELYKLKLNFVDLEKIKQNKTNCLWFFKERPDYTEYRKYCKENNLEPYRNFKDIKIGKYNIEYQPNTLLITNKKLDIKDNNFVLRRPCVQIDYNSFNIHYKKIIKKLFSRVLD